MTGSSAERPSLPPGEAGPFPAERPGSPAEEIATLLRDAADLRGAHPGSAATLATRALELSTQHGLLALSADAQMLLGQALLDTRDVERAIDALQDAADRYQELGHQVCQTQAELAIGRAGIQACEFERAGLYLGRVLRSTEVLRSADSLTDAERTEVLAVRAEGLNLHAYVQRTTGHMDLAFGSLREALTVWRALQRPLRVAACLANLGDLYIGQAMFREATEALSEAYALYKTQGDPKSESFILNSLARLHAANNDVTMAITVQRSALAAAEITGDDIVLTNTHLNLGTFLVDGNHLSEASVHLNQALNLSQRIHFRIGELSSYDSIGTLQERQGLHSEAVDTHQRALSIALDIGDHNGELESRLHLGQLYTRLTEPRLAADHLNLALSIARTCSSPREEGAALGALSRLAKSTGDLTGALELLEQQQALERELMRRERDQRTREQASVLENERNRTEAESYRARTDAAQKARQEAEEKTRARTQDLEAAQHEVVARLAMAAEYRDDTTGEHTRRVGRVSKKIALALGWPEEQAELLGIAARLHDVGKIGIPDSVLLKPGKLTTQEFSLMQKHTLMGSKILSGGESALLRLSEEIAISHHEKWNGQGYPRGLSNTDIPMSGRIVAVADVFDALTQRRPYKEAWSVDMAKYEIKQSSGTHFDPDVVEAALSVLANADTELGDVPRDDEGDIRRALRAHSAASRETLDEALSILLENRTRELEAFRRELELKNKELEQQSFKDPLTDLGNRRAFETDLANACARAESGHPRDALSLININLDRLKTVNEARGHDVGDALLRLFAQLAREAYQPLGEVYRIGGDEFNVLVTGEHTSDALLDPLRAAVLVLRDQGFGDVGASAGLAMLSETRGPEELRRLSDERMYREKAAGRQHGEQDRRALPRA